MVASPVDTKHPMKGNLNAVYRNLEKKVGQKMEENNILSREVALSASRRISNK